MESGGSRRASSDLFAGLGGGRDANRLARPGTTALLAWLGDNRQSIACLDRVVSLDSESAFDRAVDAWTLAEVLRQSGGAETLADDLRFACTIAWEPGDTAWLLDEFPRRSPGSHADRSGSTRSTTVP